jgi:putative transcriptional regulator
MEPIAAARAKRLELKLSQDAFAKRFGLVTVTYKQWERGSRKPDRAAEVLLAIIAMFPSVVQMVVNQCTEQQPFSAKPESDS